MSQLLHLSVNIPTARRAINGDEDYIDSMSDSEHRLSPLSAGPSESSATSYDVSMRSPSPTPSMWSMGSSLYSQAYRIEYGRGVNNYSDVYRLAADDEELTRLGMYSTLLDSHSHFV